MSLYYKEKPEYFSQCMKSILSQTVLPEQIVIVKDGPLNAELDAELDKWLALNPDLYSIVPLEKNQGLGLALAEGILHCRNELIARMDTDDIAVKSRFEKQLKEFSLDPELDICGSNISEFEGNPQNIVSKRIVPLHDDDIKRYQKYRDSFNHMTVMYRKSMVLKAGNYQSCLLMEDTLLWVHMIQAGAKCKNIEEPLVLVRVGNDMYERRGGWEYFLKYREGKKKVLETGYISFFDYTYAVSIQLIVALIPNKMRSNIYKRHLRIRGGVFDEIGITYLLHYTNTKSDFQYIKTTGRCVGVKNDSIVSVIIPVFNEEKYIESCIQSLISQTYPRKHMEWLIIDGNSTDNTVEIVRTYAKHYPIHLLNNEERKTPISMNIGIRHARGRYIIRFDAHTAYPSNYIERCVYILENSDADNVGGFVETRADGFVGKAIAKILSSSFGVGGSRFRINSKGGYVDTVPFGAFRKEIFNKVGLFNEKLLRSEDNELNARIRAMGGKIYLSSDIKSVYYCRDTVWGILRMGLQNGNALFRTIKENPKAMNIRHFIPFIFLISLIGMPVLGICMPVVYLLFVIEITLYLILDIYFSFFTGSAKYGVITIWLYPLFHIFYGMGSLLGLFGIELY